MKLITFQQALKRAENYTKKHLLLGNGFSIACVPTIFTYSSLFSKADFSDMPEVKKAFALLKTQDFELVIQALGQAGGLMPAYLPGHMKVGNAMLQHSKKLKERLIETIAANHPANPAEIGDDKYNACIRFLAHFINGDGTIYTLNYDLLLYWTLMFGKEQNLLEIEPNDGFGKDVDFEDGEFSVSDYVTWQGETTAHNQNIHYLHGALHVYDRGPYVEKFTWINRGVPLVTQARQALSEGRFPIFVAEGESAKKMEKIIHCGYLYHSYKSFSAKMKVGSKNSKNCLFTYGVSFSANDEHIISRIPKGKVAHLFVSIYGDSDSADNRRIIASAERLKKKRLGQDLEITYYDAASAQVWG